MKKAKTVQVKKSDFKTEQEALESVLAKNNLQADNLKANHTANLYRWDVVDGSSTETEATKENKYPFGTFAVEKTKDENDHANAIQKAKEHFQTFQGNLRRVSEKEDEQHYVFTKVRA